MTIGSPQDAAGTSAVTDRTTDLKAMWSTLAGKLVVVLFATVVGIVTWQYQENRGLATTIVRLESQNSQSLSDLADQQTEYEGRLAAANNEMADMSAKLFAACQSLANPGNTVSAEAKTACGLTGQPHVTVTFPGAGASVKPQEIAQGTVDTTWLDGRELWLAVTTPGIDGFYIQCNPQHGAAELMDGGRWVSPTLYFGDERSAGKQYDIVVIVADATASAALTANAQVTEKGPITLPPGAQQVVRVSVTRQ